MDDKERERIRGLIDKYANWIIQDRAGDHDYLRMEIRRLEGLIYCGNGRHVNPHQRCILR